MKDTKNIINKNIFWYTIWYNYRHHSKQKKAKQQNKL